MFGSALVGFTGAGRIKAALTYDGTNYRLSANGSSVVPTTAAVPIPHDETGQPVVSLYLHDGGPQYAGALPEYEVQPANLLHDYGAGAVKWAAPSYDALLAAAVAAVAAGNAPADLVTETEGVTP